MPIYLYGCGGQAKVILDILYCQRRVVTALVDDNPPQIKQIHGIPVYKASEVLDAINASPENQWIVAIGDNASRQRIAQKLSDRGYTFTTAIHPSSQIALGVEIGYGTVIMANTVINTDAKIGHHVIVNTGATIDHDCIIGDYSHLAPGVSLCGGVHLETGVFLGVRTCAIPGAKIGEWTTAGAGSIIISSLPSHCLVYGCPGNVAKTK